MSEGAPKRASIADLGMRNEGHRFMDQWRFLSNDQIPFHLSLPGHGPDAHILCILSSNVKQLLNPIEVNQHGWLGQTEVHGGDQTLSPGQEFGFVTVFRQMGKDFFQCGRYKIFEWCWFHDCDFLFWRFSSHTT